MSGVCWLQFSALCDSRGLLVVVESGQDVPFEIKRAFWITDVPPQETRGGHAHSRLHQVLIAVHGAVTVWADGPTGWAADRTWVLSDTSAGLYVPPFTRIEMRDWVPGTVLLVLCSEHYDAGDYVYD